MPMSAAGDVIILLINPRERGYIFIIPLSFEFLLEKNLNSLMWMKALGQILVSRDGKRNKPKFKECFYQGHLEELDRSHYKKKKIMKKQNQVNCASQYSGTKEAKVK